MSLRLEVLQLIQTHWINYTATVLTPPLCAYTATVKSQSPGHHVQPHALPILKMLMQRLHDHANQ